MANSPTCSTTSPTASTSTTVTDLQETDVFSDDSGVDVKPQGPRGACPLEAASKRNKRKSSEPKKRKDVLLMKRFRWDTDDEDIREEETDDVFDILEGERPSSGDSGCQLDTAPSPNIDKKKTRRTWRKSKAEEAFRQSVIRKSETTPCTSTPNHQPLKVPSADILLTSPSKDLDSILEDGSRRSGGRPRNYKSMSRQRRIEANARERTRVHTISAAFESLRRAVPAYAHNQKLSKLAILRIASAYIVALACLNGQGASQPSISECVEQCTRTIQAEGKSRRRTSKD